MQSNNFKTKEKELKNIVEKLDTLTTNESEFWGLVEEYNSILDKMIEDGFHDILLQELLIEPDLISDKYSQLSLELAKSRRPTFNNYLINNCEKLCLAQITKVHLSPTEIEVELIKEYIGHFSSIFKAKYLVPWGYGEWFQESEKTMLVFDNRTEILSNYASRMPLVIKDSIVFVASYMSDFVSFDEYDGEPFNLKGHPVWLIPLKQFEEKLNILNIPKYKVTQN